MIQQSGKTVKSMSDIVNLITANEIMKIIKKMQK